MAHIWQYPPPLGIEDIKLKLRLTFFIYLCFFGKGKTTNSCLLPFLFIYLFFVDTMETINAGPSINLFMFSHYHISTNSITSFCINVGLITDISFCSCHLVQNIYITRHCSFNVLSSLWGVFCFHGLEGLVSLLFRLKQT